MRRLLPALLGVAVLLGACGDDDDSDQSAVTSIPDDTTTSTSSTTTEPRTVPPDVIPQDESQITEEYVEQVLNELLMISLEATKRTREVGLVDEVTSALVESVNSQERARQALNSLVDAAASQFAGFRSELRPATADVMQVFENRPDCVFVEVLLDNSGLFESAQPLPENFRSFARLVPAAASQLTSGTNRTAWIIDALPVTEDGSVPSKTCPVL